MTDDHDHAADIAAASPGLLPRIGGVGLIVGSFVSAAIALQTFVTAHVFGWFNLVLAAMLVVGLGGMVLGANVMKARAWAAAAGIGLGVVLTLTDGAWVFLSFSNGLFSLLALMAVGFTLCATVFVVIAAGDCRRATEARQRLQQAGLDFGL